MELSFSFSRMVITLSLLQCFVASATYEETYLQDFQRFRHSNFNNWNKDFYEAVDPLTSLAFPRSTENDGDKTTTRTIENVDENVDDETTTKTTTKTIENDETRFSKHAFHVAYRNYPTSRIGQSINVVSKILPGLPAETEVFVAFEKLYDDFYEMAYFSATIATVLSYVWRDDLETVELVLYKNLTTSIDETGFYEDAFSLNTLNHLSRKFEIGKAMLQTVFVQDEQELDDTVPLSISRKSKKIIARALIVSYVREALQRRIDSYRDPFSVYATRDGWDQAIKVHKRRIKEEEARRIKENVARIKENAARLEA